LPPGWTETSDTTATYPHTFADVSCTPVVPVAPEVVEGSCANDVVVPSALTLANTPGLTYSADPAGPYDPTVDTDVVVTATVIDGFAWEGSTEQPAGFARRANVALSPNGAPPPVGLPEGWTYVSPTEATYAVTLPAAPECPAVAPTTSPASTVEPTTTVAESTTTVAESTTTEQESAASEVVESTTTTTSAAIEEEAAAAQVVEQTTTTTLSPPSTTSEPAAEQTTTSLPGPIPATGASGLPAQLIVALLSACSGFLLLVVARRRANR
jgi:hypothetical protein